MRALGGDPEAVGHQSYAVYVATSTTLISPEEYLRTSYKPAREYIDGILRHKSMPTFMHSRMQKRNIILFERFPEFDAEPELTIFLREGKYLVPDIVVQRVSELQQPYPTKPVHLCIEIVSPRRSLQRRGCRMRRLPCLGREVLLDYRPGRESVLGV